MKVRITEDEWYPCYSIEIGADESDKPYLVEVDDALIERYEKCMTEFGAIQDILKVISSLTGEE